MRRTDSDSDICIDDSDLSRNRSGSGGGGSGDPRRNSINRVSIQFMANNRSTFASYRNCDCDWTLNAKKKTTKQNYKLYTSYVYNYI